MAPEGIVGGCVEHPLREGTPCARCGTFRCAECLHDELCAGCTALARSAHVAPEHTVGFGPRAGARIIDLVVAQVIALPGGLAAGILLVVLEGVGLTDALWRERIDGLGFGFNLLSGTLSSLVGVSVGTWLCGATVGKAVLGLRVVQPDGTLAGLLPNLKRELGYLVDSLFFGLIGKSAMDASPLHQRHGDRWAGTTVARSTSLQAPARVSAGRLLLGLAAGLILRSVVTGATLVLAAL